MTVRRYLAWGAAAMAAGLALFLRLGGTALAVLLGLCLALGLIKPLRTLWRPLLCGLLAAAMVSGVYACRFAAAEEMTGSEMPFTGTVLAVSPYTAHRSTVFARIGGAYRVIELTAYLPEEETPLAGERIAGTVLVTGVESEGDTLLLSGGVALTARQLTAEPARDSFSALGWLLRLRRKTVEGLKALGEGEDAALVIAMLTAETDELPARMRAALSAAGISHLLAVSGLHLSILLAVCGRLGDLLLWSRRKRTLLSLLCCFAMMVLAGFRASVLRAALMAGLALGASLRGRRGDGLTGLGFAVTVILLLNPAAVWELGFLLSCGATLGILLLAKPLARLFPAAQRSRWGRLLWESASVSLAAQLGTLPIAALTFGYLPAYSLITNLLVLPLVYGTMVFAFLTLPCLAVGVGVYPFTAASCFAGGIAAIARGIAKLPGAVLPCTAPWQWAAPAVCTALILAALLLRTLRARLRLLLLGCAAAAVLLIAALPLQNALTVTTDHATGSVLVQKNGESFLLCGVQDGYSINALNRFLQRCGNPRITVLAQPAEQHNLSAELRLAQLLEPEFLLCDEETALLGEGQYPETVELLPYCDTIRNILSDYTLYELDGVGTMLQFGTQKVLKCWTGYDIITAEDIPDDVTAVIDRTGNLWLRPDCGWRLYQSGNLTITLPKEDSAL